MDRTPTPHTSRPGGRAASCCQALLVFGLVAALAACQPSLQLISLSPSNPAAALGTTAQVTATGSYSDGTTQDLTSAVSWSSGSPAIAAVQTGVDPKGLVSALGKGQTAITASLNSLSASVPFVVTGATLTSIAVTPPVASIAQGTVQAFSATGTFSDGTTQDLTGSAAWSARDPAFAALRLVDSQHEVATGVKSGAAILTVTAMGLSGTAALIVTDATLTGLSVSPVSATLVKGTSAPLVATGTFSDLTTQDVSSLVAWSSDASAVATVARVGGRYGVVQGQGTGTAVIGASLRGQTAGAALTVTAPSLVSIQVAPKSQQIALGTTTPIAAIGTFSDQSTQDLSAQAAWASSGGAASVSPQGVAAGVAAGVSTITATFGGVSGASVLGVTDAALTAITVTVPGGGSVALGATPQLVATGTYSDKTQLDLTSAVTWASDGPAVSVSNAGGSRGLAAALLVGPANVTASLSGVTGSAAVTVH